MIANASTALITGGTSGIGRAATNKLAQLGIHVLVVGRNISRHQIDRIPRRAYTWARTRRLTDTFAGGISCLNCFSSSWTRP